MQYLANHKNIRKIYLCLDNDTAGNAACENLAEKIPNDKVVMRLRPVKKDWNGQQKLIERIWQRKKYVSGTKIDVVCLFEWSITATLTITKG